MWLAMTSDERQKAARRLREIKPNERLYGHVQTETVFNACGIDGEFGCVRADDLGKLADLIDPTCENLADVNPVDGFICSACGWPGVVQQAIDNGWQEYAFDEFMEYVPRYCPYCGSRLVRR